MFNRCSLQADDKRGVNDTDGFHQKTVGGGEIVHLLLARRLITSMCPLLLLLVATTDSNGQVSAAAAALGFHIAESNQPTKLTNQPTTD